MKYVKESVIDATPEEVFRFHERPEALRLLIPPWERVKVVSSDDSLRPGSRVVLEGRWGPFTMRWVALHTTYDPPRCFVDRQEAGPFAAWEHRHEFLDDGRGGTILRDAVDYEIPFGRVGRLLAGRLIRSRLERMFAFRHAATRRAVEPAGRPTAPPCPPA